MIYLLWFIIQLKNFFEKRKAGTGMYSFDEVKKTDPEIAQAIEAEQQRQTRILS